MSKIGLGVVGVGTMGKHHAENVRYRIPEAQFRVIHLRFVEQKSIREIAQELGRSEGAVKQLQLRAIENLRAQMEGAHA